MVAYIDYWWDEAIVHIKSQESTPNTNTNVSEQNAKLTVG